MVVPMILILLLSFDHLHARQIPGPPTIVKQPTVAEFFYLVEPSSEDVKPFLIECEATGKPSPTYRWTKNGKPFDSSLSNGQIVQQPGHGTLVFTNPKDGDAGQYQCFAENEWGVATANSVFVRKTEFETFVKAPPLEMVGNEGEPFRLGCQPPKGSPKPVTYWMIMHVDGPIQSINNSRITVDPEGSLWFSNLTKGDSSEDFWYVCVATSPSKMEYKLGTKVLLKVLQTGSSAVHNRHPPVSQYVSRKLEVGLRGKHVELFCIYGGTPLPQIVWTKNGHQIRFDDRVSSGHFGKSLKIKRLDFGDGGVYTCEVHNGVGEAKSYSTNLAITAVPYFTTEPQSVTAGEDETVEFRCEVNGVPEAEIRWSYNGKLVEHAAPNLRRTIDKNSIKIEKVIKNDTGNYGCNATNVLGYVYKDVYLNVLAPVIEIVRVLSNVEAVDGKNVSFSCNVFGLPKPEIIWLREGKQLLGGKYQILENGDLYIANVQIEDSGEYICFAENKFGSSNTFSILTVREHTQISDWPEYYELEASRQVTFRCVAKHDENLEVTTEWLKNDQPIDYEADPQLIETNNSLIIRAVNELDSGKYTCFAKTRLDVAQASTFLIVQDSPNPPEITRVECFRKSAIVYWRPLGDNRAPIQRYSIEYNTSSSPDSWTDLRVDIAPVEFSYEVPLEGWANYSFRVLAHNKIGASLPSFHSEVCSTAPKVPHKNPEDIEVKRTPPNSLEIRWMPMPEIEHNGPHFHYQVMWKQDTPSTEYQSMDISDWRQSKIVINEVPLDTQYRVKVLAVNELGQADNVAKEIVG